MVGGTSDSIFARCRGSSAGCCIAPHRVTGSSCKGILAKPLRGRDLHECIGTRSFRTCSLSGLEDKESCLICRKDNDLAPPHFYPLLGHRRSYLQSNDSVGVLR